ncbi:olfactory receptor 52D1-like [Tachyglossus aculeatus]|uniref:olfactory receptor 52D1-like n=1 Tax=Tachyglossus aculeatus TaxID=9261 RepID=UPI0018F2B1B8|nr:olfactory receptor 52D1-like [Tachyglossus aculeatus]
MEEMSHLSQDQVSKPAWKAAGSWFSSPLSLPGNSSFHQPAVFILLGIPGLESAQNWISTSFCSMYATALAGNCALLLAITTDSVLHKPMYQFLAMLAMTDLVLCSSTGPKALSIFWSGSQEISFSGCLAQLFFIHSFYGVESALLVAMAFDRYVAVCRPLHYVSILPPTVIGKLGLAALLRNLTLGFPLVFLVYRLPYCRTNAIPQTYCEHMSVAKLACADITPNVVYGLTVALSAMGLDVSLIATSYGLILRAVFLLPSRDARVKALSTCGSHVCVILTFYFPSFFSFFTHRFAHGFPLHVHVILANLYLLAPPVLNPIVYGAHSREIRQSLWRVLSQGSSTFRS